MKKPRCIGTSDDGWPIVDPDSVDWVGMATDDWEPYAPVLVRVEDIPYVPGDQEVTAATGLPIAADSYAGRIFVLGRGFASDKVVIEFAVDHPTWGRTFATKYFWMDEPGVLHWGHDGQVISLTHLPHVGEPESR